LAQSVRARGSHPRGHWFESSIAHHTDLDRGGEREDDASPLRLVRHLHADDAMGTTRRPRQDGDALERGEREPTSTFIRGFPPERETRPAFTVPRARRRRDRWIAGTGGHVHPVPERGRTAAFRHVFDTGTCGVTVRGAVVRGAVVSGTVVNGTVGPRLAPRPAASPTLRRCAPRDCGWFALREALDGARGLATCRR
jgi:hypothetical protein